MGGGEWWHDLALEWQRLDDSDQPHEQPAVFCGDGFRFRWLGGGGWWHDLALGWEQLDVSI
ncbi:MAG: hypothetical protein CVU38_19280 [Chloroflexi bacterium HGW-Chloroflexi-1]|nr:MAG: hypothetical protein CVU38_19280 [Chloroflexi bacterium HGW-Chloroflexi-1]